MFRSTLTALALVCASIPSALGASVGLEQYGKRLTPTEIATYRISPEAEGDVRSVAFPARTYVHLLGQPGVVGIVAEFSADPATGGNTLMMYGVDADHVARGDIVNLANPCPSTCASLAPATSDAGRQLAQQLLEGGSVRVLTADEVQAHRVALALRTARRGSGFNTRSVAFPAWVYLHLLSQPDAIGISSHFVRDRTGRDTLLLRAIDGKGRLFGDTMNLALPCPSTCDSTDG